ncbi:ribonuclease III [Paramagnetospirillum magneticum]|uniref:Ribonuclease 3 n=1 Tax=Paramagnetospirillum magneticum (strain ATCC 700264 / AMB-1) TaxID=342108 RepID=Q2W513_PARM1|nr:ribonuclease III [Paramagnetospirillum magneticum]BAE51062.1 dsRNA-specific ribonuclease [Paramagnetospirillum magneticum AMB-1]
MKGAAAELSALLGHAFARPELLAQALTHPSMHQGRKSRTSDPYERLEFLGDRVLGLVVAEMLFSRFPNEAEGALARRHAALVRREAVARIATEIGLGRCLVLAKGEDDAGGRANPGILADACEAVIGALYADAGFAVAASFVRSRWEPMMEEALAPPKDAKTGLQEWAQGRGKPLPHYQVLGQEGPPHEPIFLIEVSVEGVGSAVGRGASKRVAEQAAAGLLLEQVKT